MVDHGSDDDVDSLDGMLQSPSPPGASGQERMSRRNNFTLDELRRRLHLNVNAAADSSLLPSGGQSGEDDEAALMSDAITRFLGLLEPLVELSVVLNDDRLESLAEAARVRSSVRELEELLDTHTARQLEYLDQVQTYQNFKFEKKYRTLESRARQHMQESQEQINMLQAKTDKKQQRIDAISQEYDYLQRVMTTQRTELENLKEATKNRISDKDLTDLRIRVLRLQEENSKLQMEKSKLQQSVDELQSQIAKNPSKTDTLYNYLGMDGTALMSPSRDETLQVKSAVETLELRKANLKVKIENRESETEKAKEKLSGEIEYFKSYAVFLVNAIEKKKSGET